MIKSINDEMYIKRLPYFNLLTQLKKILIDNTVNDIFSKYYDYNIVLSMINHEMYVNDNITIYGCERYVNLLHVLKYIIEIIDKIHSIHTSLNNSDIYYSTIKHVKEFNKSVVKELHSDSPNYKLLIHYAMFPYYLTCQHMIIDGVDDKVVMNEVNVHNGRIIMRSK